MVLNALESKRLSYPTSSDVQAQPTAGLDAISNPTILSTKETNAEKPIEITKNKVFQAVAYALVVFGLFALGSGAFLLPTGNPLLLMMYTDAILAAAFLSISMGHKLLSEEKEGAKSLSAKIRLGPFSIGIPF